MIINNLQIDRIDYYNDSEWQRILDFSKDLPTPCILVNLDIIKQNYETLVLNFPYSKVYYAVKANPATEVIALLRDCGSNFDIASIYELDKVLALGITPDRLSFGNTIKKAKDIKYAYDKGVRLFATDCRKDLENIAEHAPGSRIYVRILVQGADTADWPLSRKFGCHHDKALYLINESRRLNLEIYGISFHVGSQQRDIGQWYDALTKVKYLFDVVQKQGIELKMINIGGGLPATYLQKTNDISDYSTQITKYLKDCFNNNVPEIMIEPGRSLVGDSGVLVSEVVMVSKKNQTDSLRWVYLDAGKFNGLIETLDESIKYPIFTATSEEDEEYGEVILAGPTCDSYDVMYEKSNYQLPLDIEIGERLYWLSTGAYTSSYAAVEFNGFPPIKTYIMT